MGRSIKFGISHKNFFFLSGPLLFNTVQQEYGLLETACLFKFNLLLSPSRPKIPLEIKPGRKKSKQFPRKISHCPNLGME